jgi:uncharacterized paraquat-inducible protein A
MPEATFACPKCETAFGVDPGVPDVHANCPNCRSLLEAHFFPAFFRAPEPGGAAAALADHTEASCFYHPQKQAVQVCDGCGRLLCALCSIEMGREHLCPNCISSGRKKGRITTLEKSRTRYDSIALSLAVFGIFLSFFSLVAAPVAIYLSIRHWNTPGSLLGGGRRTRFVIAIVISVAEICFWGAFVFIAIYGGTGVHLHHHA